MRNTQSESEAVVTYGELDEECAFIAKIFPFSGF